LSRVLLAASRRAVAVSLSPAVIAARVERIAVLTWLRTARLRSCAFLLVPMRLICDLIFATCMCFLVCGSEMVGRPWKRIGVLIPGRDAHIVRRRTVCISQRAMLPARWSYGNCRASASDGAETIAGQLCDPSAEQTTFARVLACTCTYAGTCTGTCTCCLHHPRYNNCVLCALLPRLYLGLCLYSRAGPPTFPGVTPIQSRAIFS